MRFARVLQLVFLLSLALTVFGSEIVESARFIDDTSNDYIEAPSSFVHKVSKKAPIVVFQTNTTMTEELVVILAVISCSEPAVFSSGRSLLRLLSIQRK